MHITCITPYIRKTHVWMTYECTRHTAHMCLLSPVCICPCLHERMLCACVHVHIVWAHVNKVLACRNVIWFERFLKILIQIYLPLHMHTCMHACMALNRACSGTPASGPCTYIHIHMYVCVCIYAYAYTHAYTYTHRDIPVFHVSHTYTAGIDVHICVFIYVCMCFYL